MQIIYGIQWVIYNVGILLTIPIVGQALQLNSLEIAALIQRLFLLTGIASLLQVFFGHRLLLIEGPAAPWCAAVIVLAEITADAGGSMSGLRTDLQGAMLVVGLILMVLGSLGVLRRLLPIFTRLITGTVLMLLALQVGSIGVKGIFSGLAATLDVRIILIPGVVIILVVLLSYRGKGLFKTVAIASGIAAGWLIYKLGGIQLPGAEKANYNGPLAAFPEIFPYGSPTFNPDVIIPMVLLGLVLIPNAITSINTMQSLVQANLSKRSYDRGLIFSGFADFLAGLSGSIGTTPYAVSVGLIALTGIKSRLPFIIGSIIYLCLGIFPLVGNFIAHIPPPVANAVMIVSASPLAIYAIKDYSTCELDTRDAFVVGLSLLIGVGVMMTQAETLRSVPVWVANILGNGVITGALTCMILEHIVLRRKKNRRVVCECDKI